MADDFQDYIDNLIWRSYITGRKFSGWAKGRPEFLYPTEQPVRNHIEDPKTGWPTPIDDSADHYLLLSFHRSWEFWKGRPAPVANGKNGLVVGYSGLITEANEIHGEIPWTKKHTDPGRPCTECGHPPDCHHDDDGGGPVTEDTVFTYCDVGSCSCGMRHGR